jgi:hypothetical protein
LPLRRHRRRCARFPERFQAAHGRPLALEAAYAFGANGRVERRIAIFKLTGGKPTMLDAAPGGF